MPTNSEREPSNIVHVECWHHVRHAQVERAVDFCATLTGLERELRAAGFFIAADLVATAGIAVVQKLSADSEAR